MSADDALTSLLPLLAECRLSHLRTPLADQTLAKLSDLDRTALLKALKDLGVDKLSERQNLANGLAKAKKAGRVQPNADDTPPGVEDTAAAAAALPAAIDASTGKRPGLVCIYGGGLTASDGRKFLAKWLDAAKSAGLNDQLVVDPPLGYGEDVANGMSWSGYLEMVVGLVNKEFGSERPLLILGHSWGAHVALGLAQTLNTTKGRVRKMYIVASRPTCYMKECMIDAFGVSSPSEITRLSAPTMLKGLYETWGTPMVKEYVNVEEREWPQNVKDLMVLVKTFYSASCQPEWEVDKQSDVKLDKVDILCVMATRETARGETKAKCEAWRATTTGLVSFDNVAADHLGIMQPERVVEKDGKGSWTTPLYELLLEDMLGKGYRDVAEAVAVS